MDPFKYDPNRVIQAAEVKRNAQDRDGANLVFESALLEWGDDAREGAADPEQMREAIATLWLSYAEFHRQSNMFKTAMETYEKAVSDPTVAALGRVWLEYARFAEERNKLVTAQNVYLRALVGKGQTPPAVTDEQDSELLWSEFLELMRNSKDPNMTMQALKEGVQTEHVMRNAQPEAAGSAVSSSDMTTDDAPDAKRRRTESPQQTKTHVITSEVVDAEQEGLASMTDKMPPEVTAAWMARDGSSQPMPPEPPLFSPARPKLTDPTGRDILGDDLALAVIERLLEESGTVLLETCRGLWMLTALKEKEAAQAIAALDKTMTEDNEKMEASLENRLSVATGDAVAAVQVVNANERQNFQVSCAQRRQQLLTKLAWEFRNVLFIQQTLLTAIKVPGFDGSNSDAAALDLQSKICSLLHSSWFIRQKMGEAAHKSMLKSQAERLKRDTSNRSPVPTRTPPRSPVPPSMGQAGPPISSQPIPSYAQAPTQPIPMYGQPQQQAPMMYNPQPVYTPQQAQPGVVAYGGVPPPGYYPPQQNMGVPPPPPPPPPPPMSSGPQYGQPPATSQQPPYY